LVEDVEEAGVIDDPRGIAVAEAHRSPVNEDAAHRRSVCRGHRGRRDRATRCILPRMALIETRSDAGVATIILNVPPANCYSYELMRELDDAILAARFASDVHVIVVTGAGERFFCAGADIGMLRAADPDFKYNF